MRRRLAAGLLLLLSQCSGDGTGSGGGGMGGAETDGAETGGAAALPTEGSLYAVTATDNGLIAVGVVHRSSPGPLVVTSTDAEHWQQVTLPTEYTSTFEMLSGGYSVGLFNVAFGNGTLVAIGAPLYAHLLSKPPNGPWQAKWLNFNTYNVIFGNGVFFASAWPESGSLISTDGVTWLATHPPGDPLFDGTKFVTVAHVDQTVRVSNDGWSWSAPTPLRGLARITSLLTVGDQLLGFATDCASDCSETSQSFQLLGPRGSTPSELSLTPLAWPSNSLPTSVATDGSRVVAVRGFSPPSRSGFASLFRTTSLPIGSSPWLEISVEERGWHIHELTYGADSFVAVGARECTPVASSLDPSCGLLIARSHNGIDWEDVSHATE